MNNFTPILMSTNILGAVLPFVGAVAISSLVFFALRANHRRKHPTEEDIKEKNRIRKEREKLKRETIAKIKAKKENKEVSTEEGTNGLRCGQYSKKKKK